MQLLVSVRSAMEVGPAVAGGADIIDAKEPSRGSLGSVSAATLAEILDCVPGQLPVSVALGDAAAPDEVAASITTLGLTARSAPVFLKLGFAGVRSPIVVGRLIETAIRTARGLAARPRIIPVAYADADRAGTLSGKLICRLAREAGAAGVLLDTHTKDGPGLLEWLGPRELGDWVFHARRLGLITALAGGLGLDDLETAAGAGPDVIGVRGAACDGGREGQVAAERVMALRERMNQAGAGVVPAGVRETRDGGARSAGSTRAKSLETKA